MKVKFKHSIKAEVDEFIDTYGVEQVDFIQLMQHEYIQFSDEISTTSKIILSLPNREYRGIRIVVEGF
jgi:hypothetical protein